MSSELEFEDEKLYFENIESTYIKKIFNIESDTMNDDTFNAIKSLLAIDSTTLDLSGLLLEGTLKLDSKLDSIIDLSKLKKINCTDNYFDTIIIEIPNVIDEFIFEDNPIKRILFPYSFNESIDNLPNTLEIIIFPLNSIFNKPIDNLPTSLKILCMGNSFNQLVSNLPNNLLHLILPNDYDNLITKLPSNLKTLIFDTQKFVRSKRIYNENIDKQLYCTANFRLACIPSGIEFLSLPTNYYDINLLKIIDNLKIVIFKVFPHKIIEDTFVKKYLTNNGFNNIEFNLKNIEFRIYGKNNLLCLRQQIFYKF